MKKFVSNFGEINEMFSPEEDPVKSSCCGATLEEDGTCSECGAFETHKSIEDEPEIIDEPTDDMRGPVEPKYDKTDLDLGDEEEIAEPDNYVYKPSLHESKMKSLVLDFKGFVNESAELSEEETLQPKEEGGELPEEVSKITMSMVNGLFVDHKIKGIDGNTITVSLSGDDFRFAPEKVALKDFGFETWSGKPFDVNLSLDNADPDTNTVSYTINFEPKEARRAKVDTSDEEEFVDDYETQKDDFGELPETPEDDPGIVAKGDSLFRDEDDLPPEEDEEDEDVFEGRKKAQTGGFPKLKVKQAPKREQTPAEKAARGKAGFKAKDKRDLLKRDPRKMSVGSTDKKDDLKVPPIKK